MSKATKAVGKGTAAGPAGALGALDALEKVVTAYRDYKIVAEQEATKREDIRARRDVELARIQAHRDLLMGYLDRSFDERRENFAQLFRMADNALARGAPAELGQVLQSITQLAAASPFRALADVASTRAALMDASKEWDV